MTTVVIPVKRTDIAKSRLRPDVARATDLALAFALDTIAAAVTCPTVSRVVVVTDDVEVAAEASVLGASVVADPGGGLNGAVRGGLDGVTGRVAALTSDLPSLRAADLAFALTLADGMERAMVADHFDTGTTLLLAADAALLDPRFGIGSRSAHETLGHRVLPVPLQSPLRWDVDTTDDFAETLRLGVGRATAQAVAEGAAELLR